MSDSVSLWAAAHQVPLSMESSRQEYWNGLPFLSPGDLPDPGIEPWSPELQADSFPSEPPGKPHHLLNFTQLSSLIVMAQRSGYHKPLEGRFI